MSRTIAVAMLIPALIAAAALTGISSPIATEQDRIADNPVDLMRVGDHAININEAISMVSGFGNTFLVTTPEGSVIIDTSIVLQARRHKELLAPLVKGPIKYIILTHAHGDHTGGIPLWKQSGTQIIAQRRHVDFQNYQTRLAGFFALRNAAQFALNIPVSPNWAGNYGAKIEPTILFDENYEFTLGGLKFEIFHTPGETLDHLTVWIPKYRAAFSGDNYYQSFPNLYTLRGTEPRSALDYVNSLNKVLELKPEILLPSHGPAVIGADKISASLTQYRDAIQYVHDETVRGMNAGKDVFTLMREIKLPLHLQVGETYGTVAWSVRGIYEGYVGWFDMNPATMYSKPASSVYVDLARLAGGPDALAKLATEKLERNEPVEALHVLDVALAAAPSHQGSLQLRLRALMMLRDRCRNTNERGWLEYGMRVTQRALTAR